jgi:hypothetical protein
MKDFLLTPIFQPGVPVTGTHLRLLQILTLGFSAASILLFLIALPARVDWINRLVARAEPILRAFDVLNPSMPGVLMRIYAGFAIAIEISVIILYCACALLIFRDAPERLVGIAYRRWSDRLCPAHHTYPQHFDDGRPKFRHHR